MEGNPDVRTPNYDIMILLNHNLVDFLCIHSYTRLGARQTNDYIWNLKGLLNHYEPDKNGRLNKLHNSRWMTKNTRFAEGQQKAAPFWGNFASVTAEVMQWNSLLTSHKCWNKTLTVSVFLHHCTFQVRSFQIGCHLIVLIIQRGLVSTSEWPRSTTGPLPECSSPACLQLTTGLTHHSTPLAWTRFSSLVPAHHGVSGWGPPYIQDTQALPLRSACDSITSQPDNPTRSTQSRLKLHTKLILFKLHHGPYCKRKKQYKNYLSIHGILWRSFSMDI